MTIKGMVVSVNEVTGLFTQKSFADLLTRKMALSEEMDESVVLLLVNTDKDNLFATFDKKKSDRCKAEIAKRLKNCLRNTDIIAHYDEHTIAILLDEIDSADVPTRVAKKIIKVIAQKFLIKKEEIPLQCNIGIACISPFLAGENDLIERAEKSLAYALAQGPNEIHYYIAEVDGLYGE